MYNLAKHLKSMVLFFVIPKLKPENDATVLFGPGVKPNEHEIPINKNNSGCIKELSYR